MENLLNIVYDNWNMEEGFPYPNLENILGTNRFRTVDGYFNFYNLNGYIKNCYIEEVALNPDEKYYYFINGINDLYHLIKEKKKLVLPDVVIDYMKSFSNFYIVYLNEHEYEVEDCLLLLEKYSKEMGLDTSRFYMVNNNSKLEYYKEKYNLPFKVHSLDFLLQINSRNLSQLNPNLILDKEGFFMSHNRSVKPHRYCLLIILKKIGLLDDIDWSLIMGTDRKNTIAENKKDNEFYKNIFTEDEIDEYQEYIDYFEQIDIKKSKYEIEHSWFDDINNHHGIDWSRVFELKTYENSFINITTESCYFLNEVHITDKTIKPLYFYQMPLFLASYNHVKTVKERYGFDVFDDLINHSYDNEPDNRKRFFMVIDEIIRLNNMKEKVKEFYKKNQSRLFKNRIIASQLKKSKKDSNFFLKLIN